MKFYISVEEVRSTVVEVEAESVNDAILKAEEAYSEDEICLNDVNYIHDGTEFRDETADWKQHIEWGYEVNFQKIK